MGKKHKFGLVFPYELHQFIKKYAHLQNRSVNSQIKMIVEKFKSEVEAQQQAQQQKNN